MTSASQRLPGIQFHLEAVPVRFRPRINSLKEE
jgi:hypothetical protein